MDYSMMVNSLTSMIGSSTGQKAPQSNTQKSFESVLDTERTKTSNDYSTDVKDSQKYRTNDTRQHDVRNNVKTNQDVRDEQDDKLVRDKYNEDSGTAKLDKNKDNVKAKTNDGKLEKDVDEKDEKSKAKDDAAKDIENILQKISELTGISVEKLNSILNTEKLNAEKQGELKIDDVIKELSSLIDGQSQNKEQLMDQVKGLLNELNSKLPAKADSTKVENAEQQSAEVAGTKSTKADDTAKQEVKAEQPEQAGQSNQTSETKNQVNEGSKKEAASPEKKNDAKTDDVTADANSAGDKQETQKSDGEQNYTGGNSEGSEKENSGDKGKVKIELKTAEKVDNSFKAGQENLVQIPQKAQDVETEQVDTASRIPSKTRDEVIKQIIDNAAVSVTPDKTEMVLNLKPDHLGKLTLKVATENGVVTAQMVAENKQVKEIIETNLNLLRDALEKQGISVQQFSVSVGQDSWQRAFNQGNSKNSPQSGSKKQNNISTAGISGFGYFARPQNIANQTWPDSTVNFIA